MIAFELNTGDGYLPTNETIFLNGRFASILDIIESIKSLSHKVVENEGIIAITRQTEIVSAKGLKRSHSYKTYITYLSKISNGTSVSLLKSDGKEMLRFRDNFNDDMVYENFFGQENPQEKIACLLTDHFLLAHKETLSQAAIDELNKFKESLLNNSISMNL